MKSHQTRNWLSCQMLLEEQIADERHPTCTNLLLESSDFVYTRLLFLFGLLLCLWYVINVGVYSYTTN